MKIELGKTDANEIEIGDLIKRKEGHNYIGIALKNHKLVLLKYSKGDDLN